MSPTGYFFWKKYPKTFKSALSIRKCSCSACNWAVGNIRDFSLRVPKTARQQRKMIRAVFRLNQHRFRIHFLNLRHRLVFLVGKYVVLNKHKLKSNCNSAAHTFTLDKYAVKRGITVCRNNFWRNWRKIAHIISLCWCAILGAREKSFRIAPCDNFEKIANYELLTERPGVGFCGTFAHQKCPVGDIK